VMTLSQAFTLANEFCALHHAVLSRTDLILDIVGISTLFWFQVDRNHHLSPTGDNALLVEGNDDAQIRLWRRYRVLTWIGFAGLIIGFALQFLGTATVG
jgi:hypothetical protein